MKNIPNKSQFVKLLLEVLTEKYGMRKPKKQKVKITKNKPIKNKIRKPKKLRKENINDISEFQSSLLDKMIDMGLVSIGDDGILQNIREPNEFERIELTKFENNLRNLPVIVRSKS